MTAPRSPNGMALLFSMSWRVTSRPSRAWAVTRQRQGYRTGKSSSTYLHVRSPDAVLHTRTRIQCVTGWN